jgi:hypothetical protein
MKLMLPIILNAREASKYLASLDNSQSTIKLSELSFEWSWRNKNIFQGKIDLACQSSLLTEKKLSLLCSPVAS